MAVKNIMIVGVGGQGTLLTSRILGGLALAGGYDVKLSEVHGMAQRGGSVVTFVRYGDKVAEPIVEEGQADVIIAFERLEALRYAHFLKEDGVLIVNDWRIDPMPVVIGNARYPENILEELEKKHKVYKADATEESKKLGNMMSLRGLYRRRRSRSIRKHLTQDTVLRESFRQISRRMDFEEKGR